PAVIFIDEREFPVRLWGVCQSNSDSFLLAQIGHRQLMLLPSKMLICAAREALIVTVEMINDYRVSEKQLGRTGTADETDHGNQQHYREPLHRVAIRPCVSPSYCPPPTIKPSLTTPT